MKENTAMYMFCGYKTVDFFKQKLEDAGFIIKNIIVWDKERNGMGDLKTTFGYSYEFIFFVYNILNISWPVPLYIGFFVILYTQFIIK